MKAKYIQTGDVLTSGDWSGWTVVAANLGSVCGADHRTAIGVVVLGLWRDDRTRRTWMRADDDVEVERSEG